MQGKFTKIPHKKNPAQKKFRTKNSPEKLCSLPVERKDLTTYKAIMYISVCATLVSATGNLAGSAGKGGRFGSFDGTAGTSGATFSA